jgi:hypothetical protein
MTSSSGECDPLIAVKIVMKTHKATRTDGYFHSCFLSVGKQHISLASTLNCRQSFFPRVTKRRKGGEGNSTISGRQKITVPSSPRSLLSNFKHSLFFVFSPFINIRLRSIVWRDCEPIIVYVIVLAWASVSGHHFSFSQRNLGSPSRKYEASRACFPHFPVLFNPPSPLLGCRRRRRASFCYAHFTTEFRSHSLDTCAIPQSS